MANYTMTIAEMISNPMTRQIFPKNYEFYMDDEEARKSFEDKFIQYYYYREIGFETPFMFIQKLETHLIVNMPYWKQLYETELEARDINFLLNKDLKETFIREIESNNEMSGTDTTHQNSTSTNSITQNGKSTSTTSVSQNGTSTSTNSITQDGTSTSTSSVTQNGTSSTNHKESSLSDGVSTATLTDGYLTGISADTGTTSSEGTTNVSDTNKTTGESSSEESNKSTGESSSEESNESTGESSSVGSNESTGTSTKTENGTTAEKTELISQGNIGITSSAQLLKEWRDVLINMDKIIIDSCNDLFLKIY